MQLGDLRARGEENEGLVCSSVQELGGETMLGDQAAHQDVGTKNDPHGPSAGLGREAAATHLVQGLLDGDFDFLRAQVSVARANFRDIEFHEPPLHGVFHEFRQVALLRPERARKVRSVTSVSLEMVSVQRTESVMTTSFSVGT